ncbi:MAG: acyltransferase [Caldilineaceae bacterium]|nr:acyltransferase [Caldilineaceae bacterium]
MKRRQTQTRDLTVDTARGLACILLVAYHVIGNDATSGLLLADGPYRLGADLLAYIRMPLFTFLSGYVYAWRPLRSGVLPFLTGKARRLLIPMLVVGTIFVLMRTIIPGTNHTTVNWQMLHILPVEHFWFVESLFIIFLLVIPLELTGLLRRPVSALLLFGVAALLYVSNLEFPQNYFSINGVFYLLPFFVAGLLVSRFAIQAGRLYYPLLLIGLVVPYLYIVWQIRSADWMLERRSLLALWIGLTSSFLLVRSGLQIGVLAWIGRYSYTIYLFHVFFTAATRIFLTAGHVEQTFVLLLLCTTAGVLGPILLEMAAVNHPLSSLLLLGRKIKATVTPSPETSQPLFESVAPHSQPLPK